MAMDKHIGRVGALAVALGIGTAIVGMPGVAWAEPDGGSSQSSADESGGGAANSADASTTERDTRATKRADAAAKRAAAADKRAAAAKKRAAAAEKRTAERASATADQPADTPARGTATEADAAEPHGSETAADSPRESSSPVTVEDDPSPETVSSTTTFAERAPKLATAVRTLLAPREVTPPGDAPEAPAASTLLWTMLAYARRQTGQLVDIRDTAATTSAQTTTARDVSANATSPVVPGRAISIPIIGADGAVYVVTDTSGEYPAPRTYRVTVLDSTGRILATTGDRPGGLSTFASPLVRPDGTVVLFTTHTATNLFDRGGTDVLVVDDTGTATTVAVLRGSPFRGSRDSVSVSPNGDVYAYTEVSVPSVIVGRSRPFRLYRISADNSVETLPYNTDVAFTPDGNSYLVSTSLGVNTLRVIDAQGRSRITPLPFGSDPSAPIVGEDGNVYVLAGITSFAGEKTRVYTVTGTTTRARTVTGSPGQTVATADGLILATFSDRGTGTTYISRVTTTDIVTSTPIDGRISGLQVNADGTVFAPIADATRTDTPVAVVDADGTVATVTLPGRLVTSDPRITGGAVQSSETVGYVNYSADGREYVAVVNPDATIARTITLPENASGGTVFFGPDGVGHEVLVYRDASGQSLQRQVFTPSTNTYTAALVGQATNGENDVIFSPDGTGYLTSAQYVLQPDGTRLYQRSVVGFSSGGETTFDDPDFVLSQPRIVFDGNGTAYANGSTSTGGTGLYALTPTGAQFVAAASLPAFGADGIGYSVSSVGTTDDPGTVVVTFDPVTTV